jgi:hypothetical protein
MIRLNFNSDQLNHPLIMAYALELRKEREAGVVQLEMDGRLVRRCIGQVQSQGESAR